MARTHLPLSGALTFAILGYGANALAVDCFIDSVGGGEGNTGLTEDQALKSQSSIPSTCTVVKYKRGSQFNEKLNTGSFNSKITMFTNYGDASKPLPRFVMPNTAGTTKTGIAASSNTAGVTIDGLYIANSHGDGSSSSFSSGVCVQLMGANSIMQNCEITSCDIGVMMSGAGSKFLNNYVHDLNTMIVDAAQDSGTYINSVGGAEGIFVSGSDSEIAYNSFINCSTTAAWTGGNCDGGATEVSIQSGTMSGLRIHHNFAYNTCGFFEVSGKGTFSDAVFSYNVAIDSGWLMLLQVNETTMSNIQWVNNTVVQHKGSTSAGMITTIYGGTGTSGGSTSGVTLPPGQVSMTNNLIILDGVSSFGDVIDKNISQTTNVVAKTNPGVVNISGLTAADFDLVEGATTVIDQGTGVTGQTLDFLNRSVPSGSATDVGAFEYGATPTTSTGGAWSTGGAGSTGGSPPVVTTGGSPSTGGSSAKVAGGSGPKATGGANNPSVTGGAQSAGGSSVVAIVGGANGTGGANNPADTGGAPGSNGGASPNSTGGAQAQTTGGAASTNVGQAGNNNAAGSNAIGGASVAATTSPVNTNAGVAVDQGACTCRVAGRTSQSTAAAGWFALLMLGWGIRRNRRNSRA